jgi:predicted phage baseplate assembly protein
MNSRTEDCGCGCCAGVAPVTPVPVDNRPGLDAVAYRVGTHAQFLETMRARLSALPALTALTALTTRSPDDPALALLDAAATVADVLTFYQERIANEGYLRCATEDRSIRELGRLVGYTPRPGVAASTQLAFTLDAGAAVTLAAGNRAQSVPGPGELPQSFETAEDLDARGEWNTLPVRQTRSGHVAVLTEAADATDGVARHLHLAGITTGLTVGDPLLADFGTDQKLLRVVEVTPQPEAGRTRVGLLPWAPPGSGPAVEEVRAVVDRFSDLAAFGVPPTRVTARDVIAVLDRLRTFAAGNPGGASLARAVQDVALPELRRELRDLINPTGPLRDWLGQLVGELETLAAVPARAASASPAAAPAVDGGTTTIGAALGGLAVPPSVPPSSAANRPHDIAADLGGASDALPALLTALRPELGPALYQAWQAVPATEAPVLRVHALRQRASVFGHLAQPEQLKDENGVVVDTREWRLVRTAGNAPDEEFRVRVRLPIQSISDPDPNPEPGGDFVDIEVQIDSGTASGSFRLLDLVNGPVRLLFGATGEEIVVTLRRPAGEPVGLTVAFEERGMTFDTTILVDEDPPRATLTLSGDGSDPTRVSWSVGLSSDGGVELLDRRVSDLVLTIEGTRTGTAGLEPTESPDVVSLDTTYPTVTPGGWIVLERPSAAPDGTPPALVIARVAGVRDTGRTDYGSPGVSTLVTLDRDWLDLETDTFAVIRGTTVHARSEQLELAPTPLNPVADAVCGGELPLDGLFDGLRPGRWLLVSGERTDLTAPASDGSDSRVRIPGVPATELVMVGGVRQEFDPDEPGARTRTTLALAEPLAYCYRRDTIIVFGNVVPATHGETVRQVLGSGDGSVPNQSFALAHLPVTFTSAPTASGVVSTLDVVVDGVRWAESDSFLDAAPTAHVFVTRTGEGTTVVFGDGVEGARLPTGSENVTAVHRVGLGAAGNVGADRITLLTTRPQGVMAVTNPLRASGGADPERGEEMRRRIPLGVTALDRVVSVSDYADFALTSAGIAKATATVLPVGRAGLVHLTVAGVGDAPIDPTSAAHTNLTAALARFGDPFRPFRIDVRRLLALVVDARIAVTPDRRWEDVEPVVRATLLDRFGFDRRDLAQDVTRGEVIAAIQAVPGVGFVDLEVLDAIDEDAVRLALAEPTAAGPGAGLALRHRVAAHPARLTASTTVVPTIVAAELAVLLPGAPATLGLSEIR